MRTLKNISFLSIALVNVIFLCGFGAKPTITFDHSKHINEVGVGCATCHPDGAADLPDMPGMDTCKECHEGVSAPAGSSQCYTCHTDKDYKIVRTRDLIKRQGLHGFVHKQHMQAAQKCTQCHTQILKSTNSSNNNYPVMSNCTSCHSTSSNECSMCHGQSR